jgi:hypothetical protein
MTPSTYRVQEWLGPMLALLLLLASTMTSNAFTSVVVHQASGRHRVVLAEQRALSSSQQEPTATNGDDHQQEHCCEPILEAKPVVARGLLTRPVSLATGTLLALSLFFAPVPTSTDSPVFFVSARPALAAKMAEPPAVASASSTPEAQLKSAKAALADASQRVKSADSKAKALDAALQKTEPSITASEKSVKKAKEAVKQAEAKYRELQNQKKGSKVLDKESMKVGMFVIVCLCDFVFVVTSRM